MTEVKLGAEAARHPLSHEVEDYLKAIFKLQQDQETVATTELARKIGRTPAAVTKMMKQLAEQKMIDYVRYHGVRLTPTGERVALEIIRHHRLLELYLHQALGYGWDQVDAEAERLEHHISEDFEDAIDRLLSYPSTDPHGDPIPSRDGIMPPAAGTPLTGFLAGDHVVVRRVRDSDPEVLRYLAKIGLILGVKVELVDVQPFNGPILLTVNGQSYSVGRELASHIFVDRCHSDLEPSS